MWLIFPKWKVFVVWKFASFIFHANYIIPQDVAVNSHTELMFSFTVSTAFLPPTYKIYVKLFKRKTIFTLKVKHYYVFPGKSENSFWLRNFPCRWYSKKSKNMHWVSCQEAMKNTHSACACWENFLDFLFVFLLLIICVCLAKKKRKEIQLKSCLLTWCACEYYQQGGKGDFFFNIQSPDGKESKH